MGSLCRGPFKFPLIVRHFASKKPGNESSLWRYFKASKKNSEKPPPKETCQKHRTVRVDPDLSMYEGKPYRTCGPAYIIQKDTIPADDATPDEETQILKKIEADLSVKDQGDPMPPFKSVEQRLLDLAAKKLHPLYKKFMATPKPIETLNEPINPTAGLKDDPNYMCERSEELKPEDVPAQLKLKKELFEKKNIFADFKQIELPKQMIVRMKEIEKNRKPTLERKKRQLRG